MKVKTEDILAKIPDLPKGFEKLVHKKRPGLAEVESFSKHSRGPYTVSIQVHSTDPGDKSILDVTCTCPATKLCHHVMAFYAVVKELVPDSGEAKQTGPEMISEGIEKIVDGIALVVAERVGEK